MENGTSDRTAEKVILLDSDGTLLDSKTAFQWVLAAALRKNGYGNAADVVSQETRFLALFDNNIYHGLMRLDVPKTAFPALRHDIGELLESRQDEINSFDGIREVVNPIAMENPTYIITSNVTRATDMLLKRNGIRNYLDVLGGDKGLSKTGKIERIKRQYPGHISLMVGDTASDMIEGRAAGAVVVAIGWGWHDAQRLKKAGYDYFANEPSELRYLRNGLGV